MTATQLDLLDLPGAWAALPQDPPAAAAPAGSPPTAAQRPPEAPPSTAGGNVAQQAVQAAKRGGYRPSAQPGEAGAYLCEELGRWYWRNSSAGLQAHCAAGAPVCEACNAARREHAHRWREENPDSVRAINRAADRRRRDKLAVLKDSTGRIDFAAAGCGYEHGTISGYTKGCRCGLCKQAGADYDAARKAARKAHAETHRDLDGWLDKAVNGRPVRHGTLSGYIDHYCRCADCLAAKLGHGAKRRALKSEQFIEYVPYQQRYELAGWECLLNLASNCRGRFDRDTVHVDHCLSLDYGGLHRGHNLWAVCNKCNLAKKEKIAHHVALIVGWWHPPAVAERLAAATTFEEKLFAVLSAGRPEAALKRDMKRRIKVEFVGRAAQVEAMIAPKLVGTALDPAGKRRLFGRRLRAAGAAAREGRTI